MSASAIDPVARLAHIESRPLTDYALAVSTYGLLAAAAHSHADRPAIHHLPGGNAWRRPITWTYRALLAHIHQAANLFADLGVSPGEVVAIMLPNTPTAYQALLGAQALGIANPVNPALASEHIVDILRLTGAQLLLAPAPAVDSGLWEKAREIAEGVPGLRLLAVGGEPEDITDTVLGSFDKLAATRPKNALTFGRRPAARDIAAYFHTGGTTGTPKVAVHTHANEVYTAWAIAHAVALTSEDVVMAGLPLFHVNALHVTTLAPMSVGGLVLSLGPLGYRDREALADFWRIIAHYRVTTFSAVPTVYSALPTIPAGTDVSCLRTAIVGAAPLPPHIRNLFETTTGVPMLEGYGLTEGTCASVVAPSCGNRPGALGLRLPFQQIKTVAVDVDGTPGADLAPGETGVLAIKGPNVFPGYLRQGPTGPVPDPTGIVVDGWLITGDIGRVDRHGFVSLVGRAKDLIIRGGHNIDPRPVEESLLAHPDVTAAAVIGRPDPHSGEVPVAYVTVNSGAPVTETQLQQWAQDHAPEPAAAPKHVHIIDRIPTTDVGKVHKAILLRDAVSRIVEHETGQMNLTATVTVDTANGQPTVHIQCHGLPSGNNIEKLRQRLSQYTFSTAIAAD
ncbi:acyl-CoA synthetase [Nocardia sp. NPDC047648]|uniref:acyl-CoA synthetase n=1 Tax=Nocardia sp. NPDC047648 TaxID=3155625 RepID=UPI003405F4EA